MAEITSEEIMAEVAKGKPYTLVLLKRGPNFESMAHLQMQHLQHIFGMRHAGQELITLPIMDPDSELAGIGLFATADKEEAARLTSADPVVIAGRLTFEILGCMGLPGDAVR